MNQTYSKLLFIEIEFCSYATWYKFQWCFLSCGGQFDLCCSKIGGSLSIRSFK